MYRLPILLALLFTLAAIPPAGAVETARAWDECLKAPDRDCVLNEAIDQVYLTDRTDRHAGLVGSVAQTWAKAGEIDKALELALQLPDRLLIRITVMREIAAAQARAARPKDARATFDAALQLAYGWKDTLERGEMPSPPPRRGPE